MPLPSPIELSNAIYLNTSLAAITLTNGDRRVYFQDVTGRIREAQFSTNTKTWNTAADFVVSDNAVNGTRLAAASSISVTWTHPNESLITVSMLSLVVYQGALGNTKI